MYEILLPQSRRQSSVHLICGRPCHGAKGKSGAGIVVYGSASCQDWEDWAVGVSPEVGDMESPIALVCQGATSMSKFPNKVRIEPERVERDELLSTPQSCQTIFLALNASQVHTTDVWDCLKTGEPPKLFLGFLLVSLWNALLGVLQHKGRIHT